MRVAFGSATQLATYEQAKTVVAETGLLDPTSTLAYFVASCVSGLAVVTVMNPFDVMATRLYNQKVVDGKGALYTGPIDCLVKTVRAEGLRGVYKVRCLCLCLCVTPVGLPRALDAHRTTHHTYHGVLGTSEGCVAAIR